MVERRYGIFRAFIALFYLAGAICIALGCLVLLGGGIAASQLGSGPAALSSLFISAAPFLAGIFLIAIGQFFQVLIDVEESTRRMADAATTTETYLRLIDTNTKTAADAGAACLQVLCRIDAEKGGIAATS